MSALVRLDVERFRAVTEPTVVLRMLEEPWLILGSSQGEELVDPLSEVRVARRRGGGGAVFLHPEREVWVDVWIPAGSVLHRNDVRAQLEVVGESWCSALERLGGPSLELATPRPPMNETEAVCCFLGRGAGEVLVASSKLVGLAAWRSREGALVQASLSRVRSDALIDHLNGACLEPTARTRLVDEVADLAMLGLEKVSGDELGEGLRAELSAGLVKLAPEVTA